MIYDYGLNVWACGPMGTFPANSFTTLFIGNGSGSNIAQNPTLTFDTVGSGPGNGITTHPFSAETPFFTQQMVGNLIGFSNTPYISPPSQFAYIIEAESSTAIIATDLDLGMTGSWGGTVFNVNPAYIYQNAAPASGPPFVSPSNTVSGTYPTGYIVFDTLYTTSTYRTLTGDCGTIYTPGTVQHKRTFINPAQSTTYTATELGWGTSSTGQIGGRVLLPSPDTITPAQFYLVVMTLTITFAPATPLAVGNVGIGTNTAGDLMLEYFATGFVNANGTSTGPLCLDSNPGSTGVAITSFLLDAYTQQTSLTNTTPPITLADYIFLNQPAWANSEILVSLVGGTASPPNESLLLLPGVATLTCTLLGTSTGQTCYGLCIAASGTAGSPALDVKFTTPITLPNGVFNPTVQWQVQYGRVLDFNS